jgi:hypothetical protein
MPVLVDVIRFAFWMRMLMKSGNAKTHNENIGCMLFRLNSKL